MREICLTQGKVALVDDCDYDELNKFKWCAVKIGNSRTFYACRGITIDGKQKLVSMHRVILGLAKGDGNVVDHSDHDGLNNQRENLRVCTNIENIRNQPKQTRPTSSQYKGVTWTEARRKWVARIRNSGTRIYLGGFTSEIEAAQTYDAAAIKYHGEFACLNFPTSTG
jgi:hypothetical protein